jgi:hypothetical protein
VFIPVAAVGGVAVAVVDVVDVVAMGYRDVSAAVAVLVGVALVFHVSLGLTLFGAPVPRLVQVTLVRVVDVVGVRYRDVSATRSMVVGDVLAALRFRHASPLFLTCPSSGG